MTEMQQNSHLYL